jgi:hypothetical protein
LALTTELENLNTPKTKIKQLVTGASLEAVTTTEQQHDTDLTAVLVQKNKADHSISTMNFASATNSK